MGWKDYLNIYTLAGASAGAYAGHSKYGKKHGYKAVAGGALAGALAGIIVEKVLTPKQQAIPQVVGPPPLPTQQTPGQGEYVDLDGLGEYTAPPPNANPMQRAEYEAAQVAHEDLGSLSGADGLGSLSGTPGFDADTIDYDEILGTGGGSDFN